MELSSKPLLLGLKIRHVGRLVQIVNVFARHGFWSFIEAVGVERWLTPEQVRRAEELSQNAGNAASSAPKRLRSALEELGPAFVKLGQVLAVREDLLSPAYTEEFRKLHQHVVALPFELIEKILKEELGEAGLAKFARISPEPLAAGSIGQVHRAVLADGGQEVVLKVQRPNITEQIDVDLSLMETLAGLVERYIPETRYARPTTTVQELRRALLGECDFVREGGSTTKIRHNFANVPFVAIPEVYWNLTTPRVLTLSYLEGFGAWNREAMIAGGLNPPVLVARGLEVFLKMVFRDGVFHGDLHPGNLLAIPGDRIGLLDFGVVVRFSRSTREHLAGLFVALIHEDYESLVSHFVDLADPGPNFDMEAFGHDLANAVSPFVGLRLAEMRSGKLFWDLAKIAAQHHAPLPRELILFVKTLVTFEGIGTHLDPDFDLISMAEGFAHEIVADMYSPDNLKRQGILIARDMAYLARHAPLQIRQLLKAAVEGDLSLNIASEDFQRVSLALDRSSSRLAVSLIISALLVGSSILSYAHVGDQYHHISLLGLIGFSLAGVLALYVVGSILRSGKGL